VRIALYHISHYDDSIRLVLRPVIWRVVHALGIPVLNKTQHLFARNPGQCLIPSLIYYQSIRANVISTQFQGATFLNPSEGFDRRTTHERRVVLRDDGTPECCGVDTNVDLARNASIAELRVYTPPRT
jgi:hypothetical protein